MQIGLSTEITSVMWWHLHVMKGIIIMAVKLAFWSVKPTLNGMEISKAADVCHFKPFWYIMLHTIFVCVCVCMCACTCACVHMRVHVCMHTALVFWVQTTICYWYLTAISCGPPPEVLHATREVPKVNSLGTIVTYKCHNKYWFRRGVSQTSIICDKPGLWPYVPSKCIRKLLLYYAKYWKRIDKYFTFQI